MTAAAPPARSLALPLAAEDLVPHRLPMRLAGELVAWREGGATVTARIPADSPFAAADGNLEEVALIELLAQAYAVYRGYEDRRLGRPLHQGFLVGVGRLGLTGTARAGDELRVEVHTVAELEGFALMEGTIRRGAEELAAGGLKLWITPAPAGLGGD